MSDAEVRDQVVSLIAGYETTSGAMAWTIFALLSTPGAWDTTADDVKKTSGTSAVGRGFTFTSPP